LLDWLVAFFLSYGYLAVFGMLLLCGFGLPLPEDITLVSGGIIAGLACEPTDHIWSALRDCAAVHVMLIVSLVGVLVGDGIMFSLGYLYGDRITRLRLLSRVLTPARYQMVQEKFSKYGTWVLFSARFMPGIRSSIFIIAGITRQVSFLRFIATDGAAAMISVPLWVYLGFWGAHQRDQLVHWINTGKMSFLVLLAVVAVVFLLVFFIKRKRQGKTDGPPGPR
jgi:membrane protein DedA with SNARE-associated domain